MNIILNGEPYDCAKETAVSDLLRLLQADSLRVAVVFNGKIIPPNQRLSVRLHEGDRIDVLTLAGGG
jgi:thiamine biosynthesis protein ThiS